MTPTATIDPPVVELANKSLLEGDLWSRLTARIREDHEFQVRFGGLGEDEQIVQSERIMDQALGFLLFVSSKPAGGYAPSELVDIGWHTFMLYSRAYMAFCQKVNGAYIHHEPNDVPGTGSVEYRPTETMQAMSSMGLPTIPELWVGIGNCDSSGPAGNCS